MSGAFAATRCAYTKHFVTQCMHGARHRTCSNKQHTELVSQNTQGQLTALGSTPIYLVMLQRGSILKQANTTEPLWVCALQGCNPAAVSAYTEVAAVSAAHTESSAKPLQPTAFVNCCAMTRLMDSYSFTASAATMH